MTPEEIKHCKTIDTLIRQNRNFAIWRIPGEHPQFIMQSSGSVRLLYHIEELDGQQGFVIAPFHPSEEHPIVLIQPNVFEIPFRAAEKSMVVESGLHCHEKENALPCNLKDDYMQAFSRFIHPLREKLFGKLVLSRSQVEGKEESFSPAEAFFRACRQYVHSYIYLCHTPETGTWLGSTPEIILAGEKGAWQTVALAGTQPLLDDELPTQWDEKNREEQKIVANYVRTQLQSLDINAIESQPQAIRAGALSHLRSDFKFFLPDNEKLGKLLKRLHPTPAVCGLPKEESYQFIMEKEGYDRQYYSGFIGWLKPDGKSDLYVNLRCMHILSDRCILYAGGGLLASSDPESEWQETEAKMQTMKRLLE